MPTAVSSPLVRLVIGVFLTGTAGIGVFDLAHPAPPRRAGRAEAARLARRHRGAQAFFDGGLARRAEAALRERSQIAHWCDPAWTAALYATLRIAGSESAVGAEGRLFPRAWFARDREDQRAVGRKAGARATAAARVAAARGFRVFAAPVPESPFVYADELPRAARHVDRASYAALIAELRARGVDAVDLLPALRGAAADGGLVFYRTDTHWTPLGAASAAEAIAAALGRRAPESARGTRLVPDEPIDDWGDLLRHGRLAPVDRRSVVGRIEALCVPPPARALAVRDAAGAAVPEPDDVSAGDLVLVGTSFSRTHGGGGLPAYLAHATQGPVRVRRMSGSGAYAPLSAALAAEAARDDGRVLVWETPTNALTLTEDDEPDAGDFQIDAARADASLPLPGVRCEGGPRPRVVPGAVFHDGDGALRLSFAGPFGRGRVVGGDGFALRVSGSTRAATLPVLSETPAEGGAFEPDVWTCLPDVRGAPPMFAATDLDLSAGTPARLDAPVATPSGFSATAEFATPAPAPPHANVVVAFALPEPPPAELRVRVEGTAGTVVVRTLRAPRRDALLFVNAGPFRAEGVRRVVVEGAGAAPATCVASAAVRPLRVVR